MLLHPDAPDAKTEHRRLPRHPLVPGQSPLPGARPISSPPRTTTPPTIWAASTTTQTRPTQTGIVRRKHRTNCGLTDPGRSSGAGLLRPGYSADVSRPRFEHRGVLRLRSGPRGRPSPGRSRSSGRRRPAWNAGSSPGGGRRAGHADAPDRIRRIPFHRDVVTHSDQMARARVALQKNYLSRDRPASNTTGAFTIAYANRLGKIGLGSRGNSLRQRKGPRSGRPRRDDSRPGAGPSTPAR